tara:strand:+ start:281 stop:1033 length:753 start_codon:yes stop_codon:yes gene_type:complete
MAKVTRAMKLLATRPGLGNFLESIKNKANKNLAEKYIDPRLQQFIDENPELIDIYEPQQLYDAFTPTVTPEGKVVPSQVVTIAPSDFRKLAMPLPEADQAKMDNALSMVGQEREKYLLDYMPFLRYSVTPEAPALHIKGHQGRHRTRAMSELGYPYGVFKMNPDKRFINYEDRSSRDKFFELQEKLKDLPADTPVYGERMQALDFEDAMTLDEYNKAQKKISEEPPVGVLGQLMKIFGVGGLGVGLAKDE